MKVFKLSQVRFLILESSFPLSVETKKKLSKPFNLLVAASDFSDASSFNSIILREMIELGCREICCVGKNSESLHDSIDSIIEDIEAFEVVTTWHTDIEEGVDYFIRFAGGRPNCLLAITDNDENITSAILESISNGQ